MFIFRTQNVWRLFQSWCHTDYESSDDDVDSDEEFTADETDEMQLELRQICRLGDKAMLKTFLVNNHEIDPDLMDPEA